MTEREARHLVRNLLATLGLAHQLLADDHVSAETRATAERILAEVQDRIEQAMPFMSATDLLGMAREEDSAIPGLPSCQGIE